MSKNTKKQQKPVKYIVYRSKHLSSVEGNILLKVLNFAVAPTKVPTLETISSVETQVHNTDLLYMKGFCYKKRTQFGISKKIQLHITKTVNDPKIP